MTEKLSCRCKCIRFDLKNITGLNTSTVYRNYKSLREKGTSNRKKGSGRKTILNPDSKMLILEQIKNDDTQTSEEIS